MDANIKEVIKKVTNIKKANEKIKETEKKILNLKEEKKSRLKKQEEKKDKEILKYKMLKQREAYKERKERGKKIFLLGLLTLYAQQKGTVHFDTDKEIEEYLKEIGIKEPHLKKILSLEEEFKPKFKSTSEIIIEKLKTGELDIWLSKGGAQKIYNLIKSE